MKRLFPIILVLFLVIPELTEAIPAFARKYNMSCQTCHSPVPRLKAYGDEFAGNGFVLADKDAPRYYVNTGDDKLSLIRDFPIAIRLDAFVTYKHMENSENNKADFQTPYGMKLLSGGSITDNVAYYVYFYMSERGEVAGIEDAYIMFNNIFGTELDVYAGQFQISDPLFKRELRLTLEDYQLYKTTIGQSTANLTYDRGLMLTYGFDTGTDIMFEIINGNGIHEANDLKEFDDDSFKNYLLRISQDVTENIRVGVFGFSGIQDQYSINNQLTSEAETFYFGPDVSFTYEDKFEINAQYIVREDKDYFQFNTLNNYTRTEGAMIECIYMPEGDDSDWYAAGLFNYVNSDAALYNYKTFTGHAGYMLKRNIRLVGEYTYDSINESGMFSIGVVSAF